MGTVTAIKPNHMQLAVGVPFRKPMKRMPSDAEIESIPTSPITEFELSKRETQLLRRRLYSINKDAIRRYRTMLEGSILIVWRIK